MSETPENKYGTTPYSPTNVEDLGEEPRSSRLMKSGVWVLMVLHLISAGLGLIAMQAQSPAEYLQPNLPPTEFQEMSPEMLDTMFSATIVYFIVVALINLALFIVVGLGARANRNWARFMGLILAILFLLSAAYSLIFATPYGELSGVDFLNTILSWIIVLVTIWWIVQAMDKQTNRWFAMHRAL